MKTERKILGYKWVAVLIVGFGFILPPTLTTQVSNAFEIQNITTGIEPQKNNGPSIFDLLIIAPTQFKKALQPLINHKNSVNVRTNLVTLDEVYHQMFWHGRDNPEKIKYFIKTAKEEWGITYVMLVGDFQKIPIRYVYNADNNTFWNEPYFISELYYADLYDKNGNFSSWDTSGNGIYGEWYGDAAKDPDIDLYPDVFVGRLACINEAEVKTMVKKIITYETTTYGQEWFHRFVVVAGDTYPASENPNWTGCEGELNTLNAIENMSGFEPTKLWASDGTLSGPKDVIRAINKGCGFIFFEGHASAVSWSTHPENDSKTWVDGLSTFTMNFLRNKQMLPICFVGGCHNNEFDVTPWNILKGLEE
jgi:hypothetical protein